MCHRMTIEEYFVFMFITASYAKGVHESLYTDASLKFIIRTRFLDFNQLFYDLHIRQFVTVLAGALYEILA